MGKESARAVSTEVGECDWTDGTEILCIRLEFTFTGLIVQESVLTATSTNMSSTVLIMRGKLSVKSL